VWPPTCSAWPPLATPQPSTSPSSSIRKGSGQLSVISDRSIESGAEHAAIELTPAGGGELTPHKASKFAAGFTWRVLFTGFARNSTFFSATPCPTAN